MPMYKKLIFVNAVKTRLVYEEKTAQEILDTYPKLTEAEKAEVLEAI